MRTCRPRALTRRTVGVSKPYILGGADVGAAAAHSLNECALPHSGHRVTGNCAPQCGHTARVANVSNCCWHLSHRQSGPIIGACWQEGHANPPWRGSFATLAMFDPKSEKQRWLLKMP